MKRIVLKIILIPFLIFQSYQFSFALNTDTHEDINEYIARNTLNGFSLENYLKDKLGFEKGITTKFDSLEIWQRLREGGKKEDKPPWYPPYLRSVNHFHNPLTEQGYSGYFYGLLLSGDSSIVWAQKPIGSQSILCYSGCYSWYDVRDYYYKALTSTSKTTRDTYFAETFRGVGQLMHLVEDASVPAHTRNDGHVFYNYENYAESYINQYGVPTPTSSGFFSGTINNIASFIDTNQYNGPNPNPNIAVGTNIGLSEYTNANFFSEDTINDLNFPYPQITQNTPVVQRNFTNSLWNTTYPRQYYLKNCCGETNGGQGYLLSAVDYLDYYRQQYPLLSFALPKIPVLDNNVYADYASLLLPRAVGYSAGLLDYFFRGTLEITPPAQVAYAVTDGSQTPYVDTPTGNHHQQFTSIKAKVRNSTSDTIPGEEVRNCDQLQQNCILQAIARYKIIPNYQSNLSNYPPDGTTMHNIEYSYSVSEPKYIDSLSSTTPQEFTFYFTNYPIPAGITDLHLFIVFKGTLGNETGTAIAAGMKDLMEPTHQVLWNATDMFQLDGHLYTANTIKTTPALAARVDFDHDGIFNETGEPYIDPHPATFGIGYLKNPPGQSNPFTYSAITALQQGRHIRLVVLVDKPQDKTTWFWRNMMI